MKKKLSLKSKILISSIIFSSLSSIIIYFSAHSILITERKVIYNSYLDDFTIQLKSILTHYIIDNDHTMIKFKMNHLMVDPICMVKIKYKGGEEYVFYSKELKKRNEADKNYSPDLKKDLLKTVEIKENNITIAKIFVGISNKKIKEEIIGFTKRYILSSFIILIILNLIIYYLLSKYLKGLEKFIIELKILGKNKHKNKKELETEVKDIMPMIDLINELLVSIERNTEALSSQEMILKRAVKTRKQQLKNQLDRLIALENKIIMAKKEVEIMDKMSLLTNVYNDINNKLEFPITRIIDEINEFINDKEIDEGVKNKLKIARDSAYKILNLVFKIKNYTSLTRVSKTTIELNGLIEKVVLNFKNKNKEINFIFDKYKDKVKILGNKTQLIESFNNIIKNSVEAFKEMKKENKEIRISIKVNSPFVDIIFKDNGPGFQDITNAFNLFYTTKVDPHNKGYGLAMVEKTVLEHGGKTVLENLNEGGAMVKVSLPIIKLDKKNN